ncbi:gluconokinase [Streptomyces sp. NBC_01445]|uniref:gluconokinase n=1 Tax=Streptomyces sp. NBC_01445 TaxID=2903869 RepID=UPI002DD91DE7|nr:gluconokinase [Streptomyces sp. NBC_01445]WSE11359.1 gluconokinase [Streptomyces sp. NBC_01445]
MVGSATTPTVIVVTGVSGSGKTTLGRLLADRRSVPFVEGDDLHPPSNIAKMSACEPLDDQDRAPWLRAIAVRARMATQNGQGMVISCSALKYRYRRLIRAVDDGVWFLYLTLEPDVARERITQRTGHFMPAALLESQYADLEPLRDDEPGMAIDATPGTGEIIDAAEAALTDFETRGPH